MTGESEAWGWVNVGLRPWYVEGVGDRGPRDRRAARLGPSPDAVAPMASGAFAPPCTGASSTRRGRPRPTRAAAGAVGRPAGGLRRRWRRPSPPGRTTWRPYARTLSPPRWPWVTRRTAPRCSPWPAPAPAGARRARAEMLAGPGPAGRARGPHHRARRRGGGRGVGGSPSVGRLPGRVDGRGLPHRWAASARPRPPRARREVAAAGSPVRSHPLSPLSAAVAGGHSDAPEGSEPMSVTVRECSTTLRTLTGASPKSRSTAPPSATSSPPSTRPTRLQKGQALRRRGQPAPLRQRLRGRRRRALHGRPRHPVPDGETLDHPAVAGG